MVYYTSCQKDVGIQKISTGFGLEKNLAWYHYTSDAIMNIGEVLKMLFLRLNSLRNSLSQKRNDVSVLDEKKSWKIVEMLRNDSLSDDDNRIENVYTV